jgi:hypothetical protein
MLSSIQNSSSSIQYNPIPPRVWSRVQNPCSVIAYKNDDPGANSNFARAVYEKQMLLKGNILQYKKNSSNLTKKQRYTQIAKGMWTNRTKTWATQSDTYTNPNMTSLLRVNYTILDPSNNAFSSRANPFGCPTTEIRDGGNLVCNVVVDPCSQEVIKRSRSQQLCNPTTDSDVPGQIQQLCWNDGTQTWYPRQRYIMPTSGTKWPQGYKGFVSAIKFVGPELSVGSIACGQLDIPLSWTFLNSTCAPISSFNIYQNGVLILNVSVLETSVTINESIAGTYSFYVTSLSNDIESEKSNTVFVSTQYGYNSENAIITNNGKTITFLQNGSITFYCPDIIIYLTCVGGGGGGGGGTFGSDNGGGGGGGGGGKVYQNLAFLPNVTTYSVNIGNGGQGGQGGYLISHSTIISGTAGSNGSTTTFIGDVTNISADGGEGGKGNGQSTSNSGGKGGVSIGTIGTVGGSGGTTGNGGNGSVGGGGGGGGGSGSSTGKGGNGAVNISVINYGTTYGAGGGGGGANNTGGTGGNQNAGNGGNDASLLKGYNGVSNTGGGGGGGQGSNGSVERNGGGGGNGGSGIVILDIQ